MLNWFLAGGDFVDFIKLEEMREEGVIEGVKLHETEEKVFLIRFVDGSKLLIVNGDAMPV